MFNARCIPILLTVLFLFSGCDKSEPQADQTGAATRPSTLPPLPPGSQPAIAEPATQPATAPATQPAASVLMIDGQLYPFPVARLSISKNDDTVTALLFTDDPKAAIDTDYRGNSYYLTMPLPAEIDEPEKVTASQWRFKSTSSEHNDAPDGIFLEGHQIHLQASDVLATLSGKFPNVKIRIAGQFLAFDTTDPSAPPRFVPVSGTLSAIAEVKK